MRQLLLLLWLLGGTACWSSALAQEEVARVRLVLLPGGTVSVSTDRGERYNIIGRITTLPKRLTTGSLPAGTAARQSTSWMLQHNERQAVLLLAADGSKVAHALQTDIPQDSLLFTLPNEGLSYRLMLQEGQMAYTMPPGYRYKLGAVWVIQISAPTAERRAELISFITQRLADETRSAAERSVARAQREKLPAVNGNLSLEVKAKYAERVKFVFFAVDGTLVGTSNVLPTVFRWNSTQVPDGEYVIEARAVDADNRELALVRRRVLVLNGRQ